MNYKITAVVGRTFEFDIEADDYGDAIAKGEAKAQELAEEKGLEEDRHIDVDAYEDDIEEETGEESEAPGSSGEGRVGEEDDEE